MAKSKPVASSTAPSKKPLALAPTPAIAATRASSAAAAAAAAASKRKRVSKAGTKNMRKHTNIDELDDFIDSARHDERMGGSLSLKSDADIFVIDSKPAPAASASKATAATHVEKGQAKAKANANSKANPAAQQPQRHDQSGDGDGDEDERNRRLVLERVKQRAAAKPLHVDKVLSGNPHIAPVPQKQTASKQKAGEKRKGSGKDAEDGDDDDGEEYEHPVTASLALAAKRDAYKRPPAVIGNSTGGFDLWSAEGAARLNFAAASFSQTVAKKSLPKSEAVAVDFVVTSQAPDLRKPQTVGARVSKLPAVSLAHPGLSYKPRKEDMQEVIAMVGAEELRRMEKQKRLNQKLKKESGLKGSYNWLDEVQDAFMIKGQRIGGWDDSRDDSGSGAITASVPMAVVGGSGSSAGAKKKGLATSLQDALAGIVAVVESDEDEGEDDEIESDAEEDGDDDEDEDEDGGEDGRPYKANPATTDDTRKTTAQRNRELKQKRREKLAQEQKAARRAMHEVSRIKSLKTEVDQELTEIEQSALERKQHKEAAEAVSTKRLGPGEFVDAPLVFKLRKELPSSLVSLVPEGNLVLDRFKSLQKRNMIEARSRVAPRRRYELKTYESASYKKYNRALERKLKEEEKKRK